MTPERVLFRVDTGPQVGLGHLQRCLAVAHALAERGIDSSFAVPDASSVADRVGGFDLVELPGSARPEDVAAAAAGSPVVVDSYAVDGAYLSRLHEEVAALAVIDDRAAFPVAGRLCVNGGANAPSLPYRSASGNTRFLLGTDYTMLGAGFWDAVPRPTADPVSNVLLTLGGSDPHGLGPRLLAALGRLAVAPTITLVVGPYFVRPAALAEAAAGYRQRVVLLEAPPSLAPAMAEADLAVSAAGQSVYELLRLGVPTVALTIAPNQTAGLAALAARGAVIAAGGADDAGIDELVANEVRRLAGDGMRRRTLAETGRALVDGQGARRVAAALAGLCADSTSGTGRRSSRVSSPRPLP